MEEVLKCGSSGVLKFEDEDEGEIHHEGHEGHEGEMGTADRTLKVQRILVLACLLHLCCDSLDKV